ncbi:hypothetical protein PSECIP111951_00679 [Pseudoalteromonas holothuriae]|uniref:Uncharacterized protein n=1 Tax=Pseudoalteromonas holothuriae TaxID=2963714 RepID=A0ABM9GGV9_9GAMM|nr:hypothetical protein [Pseudoalteromonas sp. CIP111951]CAH9052736.1 hypothetical protein PSECIP111951_00679 [Pseudoalteromonas sp. CIP111951]
MIMKYTSPTIVKLAALLTCVICLVDATQRFDIAQRESVGTRHLELSPLPQSNKLAIAEKQRIMAFYDKYQEETDPLSTLESLKVLSDEEQENQNGVLEQLYVGDKKLTLRAVVRSETKTSGQTVLALIEVTNIATNANAAVKRFKVGELVFGYYLDNITSTQVQLSRAQTGQQILLTMYKPGLKN